MLLICLPGLGFQSPSSAVVVLHRLSDTHSIALLAALDAGYYELLLSQWLQPDGSPFSPAIHGQAASLGHAVLAMMRPSLHPVVADPR
eukprot:174298-Amphidinium_carterae.2